MLAEMLIRDDLPEPARRALELRQWAAKTSTAKIEAMLSRRSADGRMRGALQYHGAGTGRWAGRGAQLQNLPRSSTENHDEILAMVEALSTGDADLVGMLYQRPLRSAEHTSEIPSLLRLSYADICLKKKKSII